MLIIFFNYKKNMFMLCLILMCKICFIYEIFFIRLSIYRNLYNIKSVLQVFFFKNIKLKLNKYFNVLNLLYFNCIKGVDLNIIL